MALSKLEIEHCEKLVAEFVSKRRPPPHIRAKLDLAFRISGQSIEIFTVRPAWRNEGKTIEQSVAKSTYNRKKHKWKILWQRADMRWHGYQPNLEVGSVEEFLQVVQNDEYGCFFG
jgi:hypothetical protein